MGALKYKTYPVDKTLQDKKMVEALIKHLNQKLMNDPKICQKAALILESWINKKK